MSKNYEIYLDMDEVLVNLSEYVVSCYNKDFNDNMKWEDNNSYWWKDCKKAKTIYFEQLLLKRGTFYLPNPIDNAIEIVTKLHNEGFDIHILTMPQWNEYCVQEKVLWVQKYLPFIDINKNMHFTGNKGIIARANRILLDDNSTHLESWKKNNGIGIAFRDFGWSKDWTGHRVNNFDEFYKLVHKLEEDNVRIKGLKTNVTIIDEASGIDVDKLRGYYKYKLHGGI